MNTLFKALLPAAAATAAAGTALAVHFGYSKKYDGMKSYSVDTNGGALKVAVISDLQLPNTPSKDTHQYRSFEKTLTMLRDRGMDVLIIAGDFTDLSTKYAWGHFKDVYDRVMKGVNKPIPCYIMGNHDYWLEYLVKAGEIGTPDKLRKRYTEYTGELPLSHKVVNGYHFICWGSMCGNYVTCNSNKKWARKEIAKAVSDDPKKPVFVITHLNPLNTAYGSDAWGNADINEVLKDFPQVISISGHSHYSLLDERSIWQGEYTAFTTQSLDYIELEDDKYNCSMPRDAEGNSMAHVMPVCLYMLLEDDKVTVERLSAHTGESIKEPWVIEAPFNAPNKYTDERAKTNKAPKLPKNIDVKFGALTAKDGSSRKVISFNAAKDDDFVHSYKLEFLDKSSKVLGFNETYYDSPNAVLYDENGARLRDGAAYNGVASKNKIYSLLYFSDFILGLDKMSDRVTLRLPYNIPEDTCFVRITAVDSWGAESKSVTAEFK